MIIYLTSIEFNRTKLSFIVVCSFYLALVIDLKTQLLGVVVYNSKTICSSVHYLVTIIQLLSFKRFTRITQLAFVNYLII